MLFFFVFDVDEDIIKIYYNKNVKLFYQDLVDVALESGRCISPSKRYYLVLKVAIVGSESCFPFIAFSDSHLIISIS